MKEFFVKYWVWIAIAILIIVGIMIYKKGNSSDPLGDNYDETNGNSETVVNDFTPDITVTTAVSNKSYTYDMRAGNVKLTGSGVWLPNIDTADISLYGSGYVRIFKNEVVDNYRFVILQFVRVYTPTYGGDLSIQEVYPYTNFYIIPKADGFNTDKAIQGGYIDWNTGAYNAGNYSN